MPRDKLAITGHFAKIVRAPANDIFAQNIFDTRNDLGMSDEIIDSAIGQVGCADGVAIAPSRDHTA